MYEPISVVFCCNRICRRDIHNMRVKALGRGGMTMIYSIVIGMDETTLVNPKVVLWKNLCYATLKIGKFEFSLDTYQYQTALDLYD